jgi:putative flavoprotein involved in K+ transport
VRLLADWNYCLNGTHHTNIKFLKAKEEAQMAKYIETIIVGGGQAGLSVSYYLTQHNRPHLVLEQAPEAANAWRNHRWDSFTLNTPNWQSTLPGMETPGSNPDGFLSREEIVRYLEEYVNRFQLPVHYGARVESIDQNEMGNGYVVQTSAGRFEATNVVVATGLYQSAWIPGISADLPDSIKQLHSDDYRNPASLPAGSVLVVGSAQSGAQIAEDLNQAGRTVYLSVSRAGRVPRRYRGKDANDWHELMGSYERTVDQLPSPRAKFASKPHISGRDGGHTINLHQFVRDGITLLGLLQGVRANNLVLAGDLKENLANADKLEADFVKSVDEFIAKNGIEAPEETLLRLRDGFLMEAPAEVDLGDANITTVIWATGYRFDFSLVHFPVLDGDGYPIQQRGVTAFPGLYFVGLPWLHNAKSGLLFGLQQDAAYIASTIVERTNGRLYSQPEQRPDTARDRGKVDVVRIAPTISHLVTPLPIAASLQMSSTLNERALDDLDEAEMSHFLAWLAASFDNTLERFQHV